MVRAILRDEQVVLPIAARLSGEFGVDGVYVGVAARLGRRGVTEIVTSGLGESEVTALRGAAEEVGSRIADLHSLGLMRLTHSPSSGRPASTEQLPAPLLEVVRATLLLPPPGSAGPRVQFMV
jgi:hypothetical protein